MPAPTVPCKELPSEQTMGEEKQAKAFIDMLMKE
jgi:hypothetical protein